MQQVRPLGHDDRGCRTFLDEAEVTGLETLDPVVRMDLERALEHQKRFVVVEDPIEPAGLVVLGKTDREVVVRCDDRVRNPYLCALN